MPVPQLYSMSVVWQCPSAGWGAGLLAIHMVQLNSRALDGSEASVRAANTLLQLLHHFPADMPPEFQADMLRQFQQLMTRLHALRYAHSLLPDRCVSGNCMSGEQCLPPRLVSKHSCQHACRCHATLQVRQRARIVLSSDVIQLVVWPAGARRKQSGPGLHWALP